MLRAPHDEQRRIRRGLDDSEVLCFLHIPKTAGLTLRGLLDNRFHLDAICPADSYATFRQLAPETLSPYRLLRGHFWSNIDQRLSNPAVYLTMLRDPIERVLSQYHYVRTDPSNRLLYDMASRMTLEEYLHDEFICEETLRDVQTRYLSAAMQPATEYDVVPSVHLGLDRAKETLAAAAFVGISERFADSLRLLAYTFDWRPFEAFEHQNASQGRVRRESVAPRLLDRIRELNANDMQLYAFAVELFEGRLAQMSDELLWESHSSRRSVERGPVKRARITADEPWSGDGWHPPEIDGKGHRYRWMARPAAYVTFDVEPGRDMMLRMRLLNSVAQDVAASLRIRVNDISVALETREIAGEVILEARLPQQIARGARRTTRVEFAIAETRVPQPTGLGPPDRRQLGLAFGWIEIGPAAG